MKNSKKEERLIILDTLREGQITVDEAIKLLNVIDGCNDRSYEFKSNVDMEEKFEKFTHTLDCFAKDVSEKAKTTYKDFEPKLKSGTKTVLEKTLSVLGDINNSLSESLENMNRAEAEAKEVKCEDEPKEEPKDDEL